MKTLIVESDPGLGKLWAAHLERQGVEVLCAETEAGAIAILETTRVDIIVLDLVLPAGNALAVADVARFRQPKVRVVFVTNSSFFSDGSIFRLVPNACAFLPSRTAPEDLAAVIDYYGVAH